MLPVPRPVQLARPASLFSHMQQDHNGRTEHFRDFKAF